jgi:hypothetical protein
MDNAWETERACLGAGPDEISNQVSVTEGDRSLAWEWRAPA